MGFARFEDIEAWQAARELARQAFALGRSEPLRHSWAIRDQLERAALSCMNNIAEGFGRNSNPDFARFLWIASGSAREVQSCLWAGLDADLISGDDAERLRGLAEEVAGKSARLARYLQQNPKPGA